jgi:NADH-quinone oxidoreductase subunit C
MDIQEAFEILSAEFGRAITGSNAEAIDPWIEVAADQIAAVGTFVRDDDRFDMKHLNDMTAVDYLEPDPKKASKFKDDPRIEVVYQLSSLNTKARLKLKVILPRWKDDVAGQPPEVPTVSGVWGIGDWHEREAFDMFGIHFIGHPNLVRILCPEDWQGYSLRKDYEFPLEYHGIRGK